MLFVLPLGALLLSPQHAAATTGEDVVIEGQIVPPMGAAHGAGIKKSVRPRGSPADWISPADYSGEAERKGMSGTTAFRLVVDEAGRVRECAITKSSGHALLDQNTCAIMIRRARFHPAVGTEGNALASFWSSRFRWNVH